MGHGSQRLKNLSSISIMTDDKSIESSFTCLGVVINKHLTWQDHIDYICDKINKKLGLFRLLNHAYR